MACVNVQNTDEKCFAYAILAAEKKIPRKDNPERAEHYTPYLEELNMEGINYPVAITSIPRFERLNNRSVNVYILRWNREKRKHDVDPIYLSGNKQERHVNLLYISTDKGESHYVWIRNLSALVRNQNSQHTGGVHFICERCLHSCYSQRSLDKHEEKCKHHRAQRTIFPEPNTKLQFDKVNHQHPIEFFIVADLESVLKPIGRNPTAAAAPSTTPIASHEPCSASYKVVSTDSRFHQPIRVFTGENCIEHFIDAMQDDARKITKILDVNVPHNIPDLQRREMIEAATECYLCKGPPSEQDEFVLVSIFL